jgi:hypothetical protein
VPGADLHRDQIATDIACEWEGFKLW